MSLPLAHAAAAVIFQCGACRALVSTATAHVHADGRAGLPCAACGATTWLALSAGAAAVHTPGLAPPAPIAAAVGASAAPVLATPSALTAAPSLFLDAAQRDRVVEKLHALGAGGAEKAQLVEAFVQLLPQWTADVAHKALIKRAALQGELPLVGQCYRAVLDALPGDAIAKKAQNDILTAAMATMTQQKDLGALAMSDGAGGSKRTAVIAVGVIAVVVTLGIIWAVPKLLRAMLPDATMVQDAPAEPVSRPPPPRR